MSFRKLDDPGLAKALAQRGNAMRIAAALGITPQAISKWKRVPPYRVLAVEKVTGVPRHILRPDLYPRENTPAAA